MKQYLAKFFMGLSQRQTFILLGVFLGAIGLRLWGIGAHLPYIFHPDEPLYIQISQNIFVSGDLNPHFFNYPSLFLYINAVAYFPYYLAGKLLGLFASTGALVAPTSLIMGTTWAPIPSVVLLGRSVTMLFGSMAVLLMFGLGYKLTDNYWGGVLSAVLLAISPAAVYHSRLVTPDMFVLFFALAVGLMSVLIYADGELWQYIVAGILVGMTAGSKYNGILIVMVVLAAHFFRKGLIGIKDYKIYLTMALSVFVFFVTTPFILFDWQKFWNDVQYEAQHYATGHAGMDGDTLQWYASYLWKTQGIITVLALLEMLRGIYRRVPRTLLIATFPVVYFVFISRFIVRNERTLLPLLPFLFVLAVIFLHNILQQVRRLDVWKRSKWAQIVLVGGAMSVLLLPPLGSTLKQTIQYTATDSRETARVWVNDNIRNAKIGIESYSPYLNPSLNTIFSFGKIIDYPPEWYSENGFDYLIFSKNMYGRYFREPDKYKNEVRKYTQFFEKFEEEKIFNDGRQEIRIYRIDKN